jgi:hypothetical protein
MHTWTHCTPDACRCASNSSEDCLFKPRIGANSEMLTQDRAQETLEERLERLAYRDRDQQVASRESVQEQYYSQFTFQPTINRISKQLGQSHSLEELYTDRKRKERLEQLVRAANEAQEQECTFRPQLRGHNFSKSTSDLREPSRCVFIVCVCVFVCVRACVYMGFSVLCAGVHEHLEDVLLPVCSLCTRPSRMYTPISQESYGLIHD